MLTHNHMPIFTNAAIHADTDIVLYTGLADTEHEVSIALAQERLTLEFQDAEALERLRDLAAEGAMVLRAVAPPTPAPR